MKLSRSGSSHQRTAGLIALALVFGMMLIPLGCSRAPVAVKLSTGLAEQVFAPKLGVQEDGSLTCQWVEFHHDSIGGVGSKWNAETKQFDPAKGYGFMNREYVVCIPELERWNLMNNRTATFVAHPCIQESFMLFWNETTGKREAAWLVAPAIQALPLKVDSIFFVAHESSTALGLITLWIDRLGRELSRDTLNLPGPEYIGATTGGVSLVDLRDSTFQVYHLGRLCSWIDSVTVPRAHSSKQQIGTDYFTENGDLFIVSGYRMPEHKTEIETNIVRGTVRESQHVSEVKREGLGEVAAFRAIPSGEQAPNLLALEQDVQKLEFWVLGQDAEGYYSRVSSHGFEVDETLQEFCAMRRDEIILAAYTCADSQSVTANSCYAVELVLE